MLRLDTHYLWDSWIVDDGDRYHLYVLQAPRSIGGPEHRHTHATVGHAVSADLVTWDYRGTCLEPAESGFDDLAIWTGSVTRDGDRWRMFYTAVNTGGLHVFDQRIGSAVSTDLHHWQRVGNDSPVAPDPRWYKTLGLVPPPFPTDADLAGRSETWRDPLAIEDPDGNGWHLLITARSAAADRNDDGVVAHATGPDLDHLTLGPPLCAPGAGFGQLEVLQSRQIDGRWVLVFTCHPQEMTAERIARTGSYCTWSVPSPGPLGPWDIDRARPVHRRTGAVRGAAGPAARRQLGAGRLPQHRTPRHRLVLHHRPDPGDARRRGVLGRGLSRSTRSAGTPHGPANPTLPCTRQRRPGPG